MLGIRVRRGKAEGLKKYLKGNGKLNSKYNVFESNSFIYFPLEVPADAKLEKEARRLGAEIVDVKFKQMVRGQCTEAIKIRNAARGYDLYGNIAIIDAEPSAAKRMAKLLFKANKNIKTVIRKGGAVSGKYRVRKFSYVAGETNYIATYKENNCTFVFDVRKVFFSSRLSYERKRICDMVKDGERVMVMFAGVGPYAIEIAKAHKNNEVVAIELNREACKHLRKNIIINKTPNVVAEEGDVNKFASKYSGFAGRIIMPLPKDASNFLPAALKMSGKKCVIHYYAFCPAVEIDATIKERLMFIKSKGRKAKVLFYRIVRPYSSTDVEIVVDFLVS